MPCFFGTVGICYNTAQVEDEVSSWEILWDENYGGEIIMENSMRDAFIVPLKIAGKSINTTDEAQLLEEMILGLSNYPSGHKTNL